MSTVSFSDFIAGLPVDLLTGPEKFPLLDGTSSRHATAALLATFVLDKLRNATVITTLNDTDTISVFQSGVAKILTAESFIDWIIDRLEAEGLDAIGVSTTIASGDKLIFNDGGLLRQIDIDIVKSFLDSQSTALGSQIAAMATATLTDSDQYLLAQGSTALKTTFTAIAARVHSQFLAYLTSLPAVVTLADADTFYVDDGGIPSKVTATTMASYMQTKVGSQILEFAWDNYSALGGAAQAGDVFLLERSGDGRTATGANIASYVIATQNSASAVSPGLGADEFVIFRSGVQQKITLANVSSFALASAWSLDSGNPVVTADKLMIGRGGTSFSVTVDQLATFVLNGVQASVLNLTGLSSATLASGSLFLVGDGATARKATLAELETKLWSDFQVYVAALTAHTTLADANTFYVLDGSTPKKITAANMAAYMETELWDKADASPAVQAGDDLWMRRGSTSYKLDVTALANFISGITAANIDLDPLPAATLSSGDLLLIDEGASNSKVTLGNFQTYLWSQFSIYVAGLTPAVSAAGTDIIYIINSGAPLSLTLGDLWTTRFELDAKAIKLDDFATPDDNTDLNATTARHGLLPKLSNNNRQFLRGDGAWATYASVTAAATVAAGSVNTDAAALASTNTTFITSDSAAKGVRLPSGAAGDIMEIINNSATAAKLYPATGGTLNGLTANAAVVIPASKGVRCFCSAANTWTVFDMNARAATA
jgi:hypothetical protein